MHICESHCALSQVYHTVSRSGLPVYLACLVLHASLHISFPHFLISHFLFLVLGQSLRVVAEASEASNAACNVKHLVYYEYAECST